MDLVARANRLAPQLRISTSTPFASVENLQNAPSSFVIGLYEAAFRDSDDIYHKVDRAPSTVGAFSSNAALVVNALKMRFPGRLPDVTAEGLKAGNPRDLAEIFDVFEECLLGLLAPEPQAGAPAEAEHQDWEEDWGGAEGQDLGELPDALAGEAPGAELDEELWWERERDENFEDEFAPLEELGLRFPENQTRVRKQLKALRALATHRSEAALSTQPGRELQVLRQSDKGRFRRAYARILEDERREWQLAAQRRALQTRLGLARAEHERKVERVRLQRLGEDLQREAASRRARRQAREAALVRTMFGEAFEAERERVLASRAQQAAAAELRDREMLAKYEAARAAAQDRVDLLRERAEAERRAREARAAGQAEALRRLGGELRQGLAARLGQLRAELDAGEEERFSVNARAVERAFALLQENARELQRFV